MQARSRVPATIACRRPLKRRDLERNFARLTITRAARVNNPAVAVLFFRNLCIERRTGFLGTPPRNPLSAKPDPTGRQETARQTIIAGS
jgi:hypothetical protein